MPGPITRLLCKSPLYDWAPVRALASTDDQKCFVCMCPYKPCTLEADGNQGQDKNNQDEEQETCIPIHLFPCNHIAGAGCMTTWLQTSASCPLCRTSLRLLSPSRSQNAMTWICAHFPIWNLDSALIPLTLLPQLPGTLFRISGTEVVDGLTNLYFISALVCLGTCIVGGNGGSWRALRGVLMLWMVFVLGLMFTTENEHELEEQDEEDDEEDSDRENEDNEKDLIDEGDVYIEALNNEEDREERITADDEKYWVLRGLPGSWF
jgi:hypothetical protein